MALYNFNPSPQNPLVPQNRVGGLMPDANLEDDALRDLRECYESQKDFLYALQSEWYLNILFANGIQNANFNQASGLPVFGGADGRLKVTWNLMEPAARRLKALLSRSPGRREARPLNEDDPSIEGAELASKIMDWAIEYHDMPELDDERNDWLVMTGVAIDYIAWDPQAGDPVMLPNGVTVQQGRPVVTIDSGFRWMWDPRASKYQKAKWAIRRTYQPEEWLDERFPGRAEGLTKQTGLYEQNFFEYSLLNLTPLHVGSNSTHLPRSKTFIEVFEMFEVPCPKYPNGRIIVAAGANGYPQQILAVSDNPYRCIPAILTNLERVSGRLYGKTPFSSLKSPQREFNRRRGQIIRNNDLLGNPKMLVPDDAGVSAQQVNNEIGGILPFSAQSGAEPKYMAIPQLMGTILESEQASVTMVNLIMAPAGFEDTTQKRSTSAVHAMAMEEEQAALAQPFITPLELSRTQFWRMYLNFFSRFAQYPQDIAPLGADADFRFRYVTGDMLNTEKMRVRIVPGSMMPTSRTAAFATWNDMFKSGMASPLNPAEKRRAFEDIGKGDLTRTFRDVAADEKKAKRNLLRMRAGEIVGPQFMDEPDIHVEVYKQWAKTSDYERWAASNPPLAQMFELTVRSFEISAQQKMLQEAMAMAQMQMVAAPPGGPTSAGKVQGQAQAPKAGNPMGGAQANVRGPRMPSMTRNEGGNPGR